jgi:hypothetical protein
MMANQTTRPKSMSEDSSPHFDQGIVSDNQTRSTPSRTARKACIRKSSASDKRLHTLDSPIISSRELLDPFDQQIIVSPI